MLPLLQYKLHARNSLNSHSTASTKPYNIVPGWNEYVKEHHLHAKDALWWWNLNNKPRNSPIYEAMRTTRAHFKYALRFVKWNIKNKTLITDIYCMIFAITNIVYHLMKNLNEVMVKCEVQK